MNATADCRAVERNGINKGVGMSGKKTAIVKGAQQGIGAGLVEGFLKEGYNVVGTSRHVSQSVSYTHLSG